MRARTHYHLAAATTVTPVRTAFWDVRLTTEATATIATASCAHLGRCRIYKGSGFHRFCPSTNSEKLLSHFGEGLHCHDLAVLLELNNAVNQRKEREIATAANICTRCKLRATLADDNRAGGDNLTGVTLDTETLRIAVAAITSATCHDSIPFRSLSNGLNLENRQFLTVTDAAFIAFAAVLTKMNQLVAALVTKNGCDNLSALNRGHADLKLVASVQSENGGKLDIRADFAGHAVDFDNGTNCHTALDATGLNDCICFHEICPLLCFKSIFNAPVAMKVAHKIPKKRWFVNNFCKIKFSKSHNLLINQ
jgi:hypothetical protein